MLSASMKMLYLVHPKDLALDHRDEVPQYLLLYGIPMFFLLMIVEEGGIFLRNWWHHHNGSIDKDGNTQADFSRYRLNDSVAGIILGSFQQVSMLFLELAGIELAGSLYSLAFQFRLLNFDIKKNVYVSWIVLLLGVDCAYYWAHRFLHEFHTMWIPHSVHHSGETYNLATALRQGAFQPVFSGLFYFPLALLGFPVQAFSAHAQLSTLYMYWIHTELVNRLPFGLEYIFNSPMAHRMHHRPPGNCNYAGMLIWWDRMFGTYEVETERKDLYGLARQPQTFAAAEINANHLKTMSNIRGKSWLQRIFARRVKARWTCRFSALWDPIPPLEKDLRINGPVREKWDGHKGTPMDFSSRVYVLGATAATLVGVVTLLLNKSALSRPVAMLSALSIAAELSSIGRICDQNPSDKKRPMMVSGAILPVIFGLLALKKPAVA